MVGQVIESLTEVLLAHRDDLVAGGFSKQRGSWRLSDELFLVSLLEAACGHNERRCGSKRSCFEAFRSNEMDAASFIQNSWRALRNAQSKIATSSPECTRAQLEYRDTLCPGVSELSQSEPQAQANESSNDGPIMPSTCTSASEPCENKESRKAKTPSASAALVGALGRRVPRAPKLPANPSCQPPTASCLSARTKDAILSPSAQGEATKATASTHVVDNASKQSDSSSSESPTLHRTPSSPSNALCVPCPTSERSPSPSNLESRDDTASRQVNPTEVPVAPVAANQMGKQEAVASQMQSPSSASPSQEVVSLQLVLDESSAPTERASFAGKQDGVIAERTPEAILTSSVTTTSQSMLRPALGTPQHIQARVPKARPPPILVGDCGDSEIAPTAVATKSHMTSPVATTMPTSQHSMTSARISAVDCGAKQELALQNKTTSTPSSSGGHRSSADSPRGDTRCQGVRGENPYKRKWNPRLAAANRRDLENARREKEEAKLQETSKPCPSLADCLSSEADAIAEAEARAAMVEASEAEARAAALAEYAAKTNLADQRFTRQQDSEVSLNVVSRQPLPADTQTGDSDENPMANPDFGTTRSGISLAAPIDRGPEHRPVGRQTLPQTLDGERSVVLPSPRSHPTALHPERPQHRKADARSPSPRTQRKFSFCDSPVISDAVDADSHSFAKAEPRSARSRIKADERQASIDAVGHDLHQALPEPSSQRPPLEREAPRRAMAEIRAAAERRAYARNNAEDEIKNDLVPVALDEGIESTLSNVVESRRNMSAIRAIAERRAGGLRSTTPRGKRTPVSHDMENGQGFDDFLQSQINEGALMNPAEVVPHMVQTQARTPKEGEMRCGGVYKPSRVYGGRANGGAGRADALGLKFGQPPPR